MKYNTSLMVTVVILLVMKAQELAEAKFKNAETVEFRRQTVKPAGEELYAVCGQVGPSFDGPFQRYIFISNEDFIHMEPMNAELAGKPTLKLQSFRDYWERYCDG